MQKIVSFKLDPNTPTMENEHLVGYLEDGWQVVQIAVSAGGSGAAFGTGHMERRQGATNPFKADGRLLGWGLALLEKNP